MSRESSLEAMVRQLREERDELKFEKACAFGFAVLLLVYGLVHFAFEHAPI